MIVSMNPECECNCLEHMITFLYMNVGLNVNANALATLSFNTSPAGSLIGVWNRKE